MAKTPNLGLTLFGRDGWREDNGDPGQIDGNMQLIDASSPIRVATVTLTSAQIKALVETPVQLVGAAGANKVIHPWKMELSYHFATTAYIDNDGTNFADPTTLIGTQVLKQSTGWVAPSNSTSGGSVPDGFLLGTENSFCEVTYVSVGPNSAPGPSAVNLANQALFFGNRNFDYTNGDGTLTVTVYYTVVTLS